MMDGTGINHAHYTWGPPVEGLPEVDLLHGANEEGGERVSIFSPGHVRQRIRAVQLGDPALYSYLCTCYQRGEKIEVA